jgi:hypothetical protein
MNTITNHEMRPLTAEELDAVEGGMTATFSYKGVTVEMYADAHFYSVAVTSGSGTYEITQY